MLPEKKTNTNIGVGVGLVLQIIGQVMQTQAQSNGVAVAGLVLGLLGLAVFVWGCWNYAEGKGYPGPLGLLGLLSCLGLIILVLIPDKHRSR